MPYPLSVDADMQRILRNAALLGKVYTAAFTSGTAQQTGSVAGLSLFNAATARAFIVFSARCFNLSASNTFQLRTTTTDPALGSSVTPQNNLLGGQGAASLATVSLATTGVSTSTGTYRQELSVNANGGLLQGEFLTKDADILVLPAGQSTGLLITINGANTNTIQAEFVWAELNY